METPVKQNLYDAVPYPTWPRVETHPDRLAAIGILMGMTPAPVTECRVLEIGCGDGGNLIPMAYALPGSRFTGLDLAASPIAAARATVRRVGLRNVEFRRADLRTLLKGSERFDYILAHGVYSWVPAEVRDALLAVCRRCLTPQGIAFVSYNTYPGRHLRQMLREMMLYHTAGRVAPEDAREFLAFLRSAAMAPAPWRALLDDEIASTLERDDAGLVHDDLARVSQPVYFHEFAADAARHKLQYLGDAHLHETIDHRGVLRALGRDRLAREQYLDFLKVRRFRQTLLCRAEVRLGGSIVPRNLRKLAFSSPARREGDTLEGSNKVRIRAGDPAVEATAATLAEAWPRPVPYAKFAHPQILRTLLEGGFVEAHAHVPEAAAPGDRPRATAMARDEAVRSQFVTNLCHHSVQLDAPTSELLRLMNGTRDHSQLAQDWAGAAKLSLRYARESLPVLLEWMSRMALF